MFEKVLLNTTNAFKLFETLKNTSKEETIFQKPISHSPQKLTLAISIKFMSS